MRSLLSLAPSPALRNRGLACAAAVAVVLLMLPRVDAQRQVFSTGTAQELAVARGRGLDRLALIAQLHGVEPGAGLRVAGVHVDRVSMAHTRVQQLHRGVPVFGGEAIAHFSPDGEPFAETDNLVPFVSVNTTPTLTPQAAIAFAVNDYGCSDCLTDAPVADLWVLRQDGVDHLVYRVQMRRIDGTAATAMPVVFIDAHGGFVVSRYDNLQTGTGSSLYSGNVSIGTSFSASNQLYFLENLVRRVGTFDNRNQSSYFIFRFFNYSDLWNSSDQRAAVDAHYGMERFFDYLQSVHGRNGIDGSAGPYSVYAWDEVTPLVSSIVHFGSNFNNAFWDSYYEVMVYGDGDGSMFSPLVAPDIAGHEMTHGVTHYSANLTYQGESGALSESWSDVFGAMLERSLYGESANTWLLAEQALTPSISGDALRYMDDPHRAPNYGSTPDDDPDHYSERYTGSFDNGGVHINSGIANKAFYLLAKGGTHHLGGSMTGIGADAAARIWFVALTSYMTSSTGFAGARTATMQAAAALHGSGSPTEAAVANAWCLVGVGTCFSVQAISVSPSSGVGTSQTFTLQYSDSFGAHDLASARVRFGASNVAPNTCTVWYNAGTGAVGLLNDTGTDWTYSQFGEPPLQNSQCTLHLAGSSATGLGNTLTMQLSITFAPTFYGFKNIYMLASSATNGASTGWQHRGTWTVPVDVQAIAVLPSAGSGSTQSFTLQYSDSIGAGDLTSARVRFAASNVAAGSCTVWYNAATSATQLMNDGGTGWLTGTMGVGTLENAQCLVNLAGSSAIPDGNNLTLALAITFKPAFAGTKNVYMFAGSATGASSGWIARGTWTVPDLVQAISVSPAAGAGAGGTFTLAYSDLLGVAADLTSARVRFAASNVGTNTCTVWYNAVNGVVQLLNDVGTVWESGTFGSGTLENSQCSLNLATSSAIPIGANLTLALNLTFKAAFAGAKNVYMLAGSASGPSTGWQLRGTWTVPAPVVSASSVSPNAGSGAAQLFTLQYSDTLGATDLTSARVRFAASNVGANTCTVWYNAATGVVQLLNDAGNAWASGTLGSGTLENGQCTLQLVDSTATPAGNDLQLVLSIVFKPAFTGLKNIYMLAGSSGGVNTGWQLRGSWTPNPVPAPGVVQAISVTPASTPTPVPSQIFTLQYSDTAGAAADLTSARVRFSTSPSVGAGTCTVWYNAVTNVVQLLDDAGSVWQLGTLGSGMLANAQCSVDLTGSSATPSGNNLELVLSIVFNPAFAGLKNVYMLAASATGANTGWQLRGSWIPYADPLPAAVSAISVSPNAGSGGGGAFTLQYSDSWGAEADLTSARVRFGASNVGPGTCTVDYNAVTGAVRMLDDAASVWQSGTLGSGVLQNSQCTVNLAASTASAIGTSLTLTLDVHFSDSFIGVKNIYLLAASAGGANTGWAHRGTFTVNVPFLSSFGE